MAIDDIINAPGAWLAPGGETNVVISSRIRLARNVADAAFPGWAGEEERMRLCARLRDACLQTPSLAGGTFVDMGRLTPVEKDLLKERHLISHELAEKGRGSALVVSRDGHLAVMVNEEDHLRLQGLRTGMALEQVWGLVDALDTELEQRVPYTFSSRLGHLTACPSNVGTGLRASVMLHLSGLKLAGEVDAVLNGLNKLGLAVRGLLGEGTEAHGNMFQVSNQSTLGESEAAIVARLLQVVGEVARHEQHARERLMEKRPVQVRDHVARSYGLLVHARLLDSGEAIDMLSGLRLGVEMGLLAGLTVASLNALMLQIQPGHLQRTAGRLLSPDERDERRAGTVRAGLKDVVLKD